MIIAIVGPTGVGKSSLAIALAKATGGEIINGDAFQIYKEMNIGTAKPTEEERTSVPHHLFDYVSPDHSFSVYDYQTSLRAKIEELQKKKVPIIVCGGTGMYLKAGFYDFGLEKQDADYDMSSYEKYSNEELHDILKGIDPKEAEKIHPNNRKRVMRAIQIYLVQGKSKSEIIDSQKHEPIYDVTFVGLTRNRDELNEIINHRVDLMVKDGLFEEVGELMKKYPLTLRSFQAIGYKEIMTGLTLGQSREEIIELIKKNSRNYAKRQMTYFNHQMEVYWFEDRTQAFDFALSKLQEEK